MIDVETVAAEIAAALEDEVSRRPGEISVYEYAAQRGISVAQARRRLEYGVIHGQLEKRLATLQGHRVSLYRRRAAAAVA